MSSNEETYSTVCSKIGVGMLLFYAFFVLSAVGVEFFSVFSDFFASDFESEVIYEILSAVAYFFSFSGAAYIIRKTVNKLPCSKPIYTSFKFNKWIAYAIVAIIAVNFTLAYVNAVMVSSLSPSFASELDAGGIDMEGRSQSEILVFFAISVFSTAIVPAVCEEYLFRGAVLTNLMPFGKTTAILGSALLFGLMHQNPLQILYTTLMGVVIGFLYVKTKSIWMCMILHFANNFITVLEEYLPLLTKLEWIGDVLDLSVMILGGIALLFIILKKDKEPTIEENGSFGVLYEKGMDFEEYELNVSSAQKVKLFFRPTVIIYTCICVFSMVAALLAFVNLEVLF